MSTSKKAKHSDRNWNGKKNIESNESLRETDNSRLDNDKSNHKADFWTVDKLISMSRHLNSAYGVDF